ncbi:hypothetical protein DPMN_025029 [Dreissena polymorpha]|uniref:Uncharacterized protein n=1 Tax=Dreissena polymorpha TaxID=45954 RepID=A0A9D4LNJ4_DREPO|nr:hypothetical protein DPMN_025029 [Dreissena polymorpha]
MIFDFSVLIPISYAPALSYFHSEVFEFTPCASHEVNSIGESQVEYGSATDDDGDVRVLKGLLHDLFNEKQQALKPHAVVNFLNVDLFFEKFMLVLQMFLNYDSAAKICSMCSV